MYELNIQKLLRTDATAMEQIEALGIRVNAHPKYPNLKLFVYSMIDSANFKNHPIVCESRGLMLDSDNNWAVVAHPFNRFFNLGETGAANIDWSTARFQEKLDGSLIVMYYYAGAWHVNTRKTPGANAPVGDWGISFAELFWSCWHQRYGYGDVGAVPLIPGSTYCWELTSPLNRVVTHNVEDRITLLAVRDADGQEQDVQQYKQWFDVVRHFEFDSAEAAAQAAELLDPMKQEGFVVVDANFQRVKIKGSQYVAIHHTVTSLNTRSIVELIRKGEAEEVMVYFPEIQREYARIADYISAEAAEIDRWFSELQPWAKDVDLTGDRFAVSKSSKPFSAAMAKMVPNRYHPAMFGLLKKQASSGREWILQQDIEPIMRWMNFKVQRMIKTEEE